MSRLNNQFDPRHSTHDPLDLIDPSVPDMGSGAAAGHGGSGTAASAVDPFPYDPSGGNSYAYDPYSQQPSMEMPDARNYAPGAGGYPSYGGDGGYGAAAALGAGAAGAGVAGYGAGRGYNQQSNTDYSSYSTSDTGHGGAPTSPPMTAAQAKQREAANERARNRQSPQWGSYSGHGHQNYGYGEPAAGGSGSPEESDPATRRQSQAFSDGVYQHTDYGSAQDGPEEELEPPAEIPPK